MKYLITEYKDRNEKEILFKKGLYCYDLRDSDFGNGIANIEPIVLVNRVGSIITNKSIYFPSKPNNFIDYDNFVLKNKQVDSIEELLISKIPLVKIKLDTDDNINQEFDFLFSDCKNYTKINRLPAKEKKEFIIDHYQDVNDYDLMQINDKEYQLYSINYDKSSNEEIKRVKSKDYER